jgi:hypothetical protein
MTPERTKCAVREAPQRRPLLDNGSLKYVSAATDKHRITGTVRGGDLERVRPEVMKGEHV